MAEFRQDHAEKRRQVASRTTTERKIGRIGSQAFLCSAQFATQRSIPESTPFFMEIRKNWNSILRFSREATLRKCDSLLKEPIASRLRRTVAWMFSPGDRRGRLRRRPR